MAQKPTEAHSVRMMLPFGFLPLASLPNNTPRAFNWLSKAAITSALPTAEHDFPEQTNTWCRIGAEVTGARAHNSSGFAMNSGLATLLYASTSWVSEARP